VPWIAFIWTSPEIEHKLRHKHQLTPSDVDEAACFGQHTGMYWEGDRLHVEGGTYHGLPLLVVLVPLNPSDPDDGAWQCVTAYPLVD
jgi:hypothetical protein